MQDLLGCFATIHRRGRVKWPEARFLKSGPAESCCCFHQLDKQQQFSAIFLSVLLTLLDHVLICAQCRKHDGYRAYVTRILLFLVNSAFKSLLCAFTHSRNARAVEL